LFFYLLSTVSEVAKMTIPFNTEYERLRDKARRPSGVSGAFLRAIGRQNN
jgi:hypothetical protein